MIIVKTIIYFNVIHVIYVLEYILDKCEFLLFLKATTFIKLKVRTFKKDLLNS